MKVSKLGIQVSRGYELLAVQSTLRREGPAAATWPQLFIQHLVNATALALGSMQTWHELTHHGQIASIISNRWVLNIVDV